MSWRHSSLIVLALVVLLVAACGPLPTDSPTAAGTDAPAGAGTAAPTGADTAVPSTTAPQVTASEPGGAVDPDNYRAMGAPDAPVTIIEYSDFQ